MPRNTEFRPGREPFAKGGEHDLRTTASRVQGPFSFLNPTRAHYTLEPKASKQTQEKKSDSDGSTTESNLADSSPSNVKFLWRSRDNRKGRHALIVEQPQSGESSSNKISTPQSTFNTKEILKTIGKMFTHYPIWDISWLVAYIFTWGSIVWCINGFFSFLPYIRPSSTFPGEVVDAGGISAFIGAVLFFETGSILLMFEAVNENKTGCFGWAVEKLVDDEGEFDRGTYRVRASLENCKHHHPNRKNFVGNPTTSSSGEDGSQKGKSWQWFPSMTELRSHYFHELGFIASFSQFMGATIFSIAGFTALPGINNKMSQGLLDGIYWVPQIVGGSGFIISGTLYMLETQRNWYTPSFGVLGWWIAAWNLIGGIGFTLCGALGPAAGNTGAQYQASCATFWGSFAFLIGSLLQLYESLQKNPVEVVKSKSTTS